MKSHSIIFRKLDNEDLKLLHQWFKIPHVKKWYARDKNYTIEEIQEKYLKRINDSSIPNFIICDQEKPVGYIQYYHVKDHFPEGMNRHHPLFDKIKPDLLSGIDLFIADENYLHTGFGSIVLKMFLDNMRDKFQAVIVDPVKDNISAIKFFEKNGFKHIASQDEQHDLMLRNLIDENLNYTI